MRTPLFSICTDFLLVGSLICAVAPTSKALIVGRAISGIGGGVSAPDYPIVDL